MKYLLLYWVAVSDEHIGTVSFITSWVPWLSWDVTVDAGFVCSWAAVPWPKLAVPNICPMHSTCFMNLILHVAFTIMIFCEDKRVRRSYLYDGFSSLRNTMRDAIFQQFTCLHTVLHAWWTAHFLSLVTDLYRGAQCTEICSQCCTSWFCNTLYVPIYSSYREIRWQLASLLQLNYSVWHQTAAAAHFSLYQGLVLCPFVLRLFTLMPLPNLHHFLIYALSFWA